MDSYDLIFNVLFNGSIFFSLIILLESYYQRRYSIGAEYMLIIFFATIYILVFGNRPILELTDTFRYTYNYINKLNSLEEVFNYPKDNTFYLYSYFFRQFIDTKNGYLSVLALTFILPYIVLIKKLNLKHPYVFFILLSCTFSFSNLATNIMRQGFGTSFFLMGIVYYLLKNRKISYIFFLISVLWHGSLILAVAAFFASGFIKKQNIYIIYYLLATVVSVLNINVIVYLEQIPVIGQIFVERASGYDEVIGNYRVGFRIDFYIYNTFFLMLFIYIYKNMKDEGLKSKYAQLIRTYVLLSGYFYLMFSQSFSDRYGVLSWVLVPLLFIPFYQKNEMKIKWLNSLTIFLIYACISYIFKYK